MRRTTLALAILCTMGLVALSAAMAQYRGYRGRTPDRGSLPTWENDAEFPDDVFTFVRIRYSDGGGRGGYSGYSGYGGSYGRYGGYGGYGRGGKWRTDWPDSDWNFSYRLQQLTSMKVHPEGKILELTDDELFDYPFVYMIEPGQMVLLEDEVVALRRYLENGGFLMVDDFWGEYEWQNFYREIKRVFPDREPLELPLDHPIFHCVYDLKEKPQIPSINAAMAGRYQGITWERYDAQEAHYKGIFDDDGRMMAIICHNTDLGDGWEREGEDPWYFREFSEKKAYPLGINIIVYALTH